MAPMPVAECQLLRADIYLNGLPTKRRTLLAAEAAGKQKTRRKIKAEEQHAPLSRRQSSINGTAHLPNRINGTQR
jgi:hypothetical protein